MRSTAVGVVGCTVLALTGCGARTLTIVQADRINNAMHHYLPVEQRTGEPLEVSIVCVQPDDLERDENAGLKPKSGMTSKTWYDHRPTRGGGEGDRFVLPVEQIYLLTNAAEYYGKKKGPALNGALKDGRSEIKVGGVQFRGTKLYSRNSAIYVFPKFIGPDGTVLPVPAAEFSPPAAYTSNLRVKIGVEEGRGVRGQYIENISDRRLYRSRKRE